jgi:hypothetical protein
VKTIQRFSGPAFASGARPDPDCRTRSLDDITQANFLLGNEPGSRTWRGWRLLGSFVLLIAVYFLH